MKVIIQDELRCSWGMEEWTDFSPEEFRDMEQGVEVIRDTLKKNCVSHRLEFTSEKMVLEVYPQKITLDEYAMNELFSEVFCEFEYSITYAALGGAGCDFAISVWKK